MKTKRALSFLLACLMILGICPLSVFAADSTDASTTEEAKPYSSYYVQEGLIYFWNGEGNTLTATAQPVTKLTDARNGLEINRVVTSPQDPYAVSAFTNSNTSAANATGAYKTDKGVLFRGYENDVTVALVLTDLVPTRLGDAKALADMTLEVSQAYPQEMNRPSTSVDARALHRYSRESVTMTFGPAALTATKGSYQSVNLGGTYYYPFTYQDQLIYVKSDVYSVPAYYTYADGSMTQTGTFSNLDSNRSTIKTIDEESDRILNTLTSLASQGSGVGSSYINYSPYDAEGKGPYEKVTFGGKTLDQSYNAQSEKFLNAPLDTAFTTSVVIDYDYQKNDTATTYGYEMTLGRDGNLLSSKASGTYDATADMNGKAPTTGDLANAPGYEGNYSFTYGSSIGATIYYCIRLYDRPLNEDEIAQNHFVDLAYALDVDLTAYAKASDTLKKEIHERFKGLTQADITAERMASDLDALLLTNGQYPKEGFSDALSFEGYQMRLYGTPAIRSRFTLNMEAVTSHEGFSVKELGVLTKKADADTDFESLSLIKNADGTYTHGEGVQRDISYVEGNDTLNDGTFGAVVEIGSDVPVYIDEYICRAYAIIAYKEGTAEEVHFVSYCDGAGDAEGLGETVSFLEMAIRLIDVHPESPVVTRVYFSQGVDTEMALSTLETALLNAKGHFDAVNALYDAWLSAAEKYKEDMIAYQRTALKASKINVLNNAKLGAATLKAQADILYSEINAYLSSKRAEDMQSAKEFADAVRTACIALSFVANSTQDAALAQTVKDALEAAEGYYQGLSRTILPKELTLTRVQTKINSACSALTNYVLETRVQARMYVLGDSTVCHRTSAENEQGWVDHFLPYVNTNALKITNYAVGGWSFKGMLSGVGITNPDTDVSHFTDYENGRFQLSLDLAGEGDFIVFASTSPNDFWQDGKDFYYKTDEFGNVIPAVRVSKSEHYFIDENGNRIDLTEKNCAQYGYEKYTWKATPNEYYHMLKDCIDKTLAVGATPVLVTSLGSVSYTTSTKTLEFSITRNGVTENYKIPFAYTDTDGSLRTSVEEYEEVKRILAREYEGRVVLIDHVSLVLEVYKKDFDAFVASGMSPTDALNALRTKYNAATSDQTHQGKAGAELIAEKIVGILRKSNCELKNYLITEE